MPRLITVGNQSFNYPENGDSNGWGEEATDCVEALADRVNSLSGANDIDLTEAILLDNQSTYQNVSGCKFNVSDVRRVEIEYYIHRTNGSTAYDQSGLILCQYNGANWTIDDTFVLNGGIHSGIEFYMAASGQLQYLSSSIGGTYSGKIKFKARTIIKAS